MQKGKKNIVIAIFALSVILGFVKNDVYAAEVQKTITGFEEFDLNANALHLTIENKPSLEEITEIMPERLGVYLDANENVEYIDVDWFCVAEDYENCDNFYFQFSPQWDESKYILSEDIFLLTDAPYVGVFFTTEEQAMSTLAVTSNSNEEKIFRYLVDTMDYSAAAACGVMANIYCESGFIPINLENIYEKKYGFTDASYTYAVDSGEYKNFVRDAAGYGLCQWTYWTRKQELLKFAQSAGKSIGDLTMQLDFLNKELSGTPTDDYARDVPNTDHGAYKVGYYFCEKYENPAQTADEKSVYRGNLAKKTYWPEYYDEVIDYTIRMSGQNAPSVITKGGSYRITGMLDCDANITNITLGIYDFAGNKKGGNTFNPNAQTYDLSKQNPMMGFEKLEPGVYVYKVSASNKKKTQYLIDQKFIVLANSQTVADGKYMMKSRVSDELAVHVAYHSNNSGANIELAAKTNTPYQFFNIKHVGGGYYTIQNCGSGKYMDVANGTAANEINVQQRDYDGGASQKWQILPLGDSYCFVPQCATAYCLNMTRGGAEVGSNLQIYQPNLSTAQKFRLTDGADVMDPTIRLSGANKPGTITVGSSFAITGVLDCNINITNISIEICDYSGTKKGGNNFNPGTRSYDLAKQNPMMGFEKLQPGVYVYKVSASNARKTQYLIDQKFIVLANEKTIADGKYIIRSRVSDHLAVHVAYHSNVNGANIELASKINTPYQFFDIKYVGDGYYTIQNCGSGKYMDVTNGTAANEINVQQKEYDGSASQKWQILQLGDSYCFVPQCATSYCLNMTRGGAEVGSNLQIYQPNLSTAQKFTFKKVELQEIFTDIKPKDWFYNSVEYVYKNDLMSGYEDEGLFKPNMNVTRAQIITTLYRLDGEPKVTDYKACDTFSDVESGKYYTDAVCWAYNEGIATGNTDTYEFDTTDEVTRQQLATFMFRYAKYKGYNVAARGDISGMLNSDKVRNYALEAVKWSVGEGLISGKEQKGVNGNIIYDLDPAGNATRAQLAAILERFCKKYEK